MFEIAEDVEPRIEQCTYDSYSCQDVLDKSAIDVKELKATTMKCNMGEDCQDVTIHEVDAVDSIESFLEKLKTGSFVN